MSAAAATSPRFVVVHGHFCEPPRANPWLERTEREERASPAHDWNERLTRECYATNTPRISTWGARRAASFRALHAGLLDAIHVRFGSG